MSESTSAPPERQPKGQAGADPHSIPLDRIDVSDWELFTTDTLWGFFERLRREDPVHYFENERFGSFWSVTRYADIVQVEKDHEVYSSAMQRGGVTIKDEELRAAEAVTPAR